MDNTFTDRYKGYAHSPIVKIGDNEIMTIDKIAEINPVSDSPENNIFTFTISTNDLDRCNDIMIPTGAMLDLWNKNPVVLSRHNSYDFPYGKGLYAKVVGNTLESQAMFHDFNDEAILIRKLLNGGYLKTTSVGFIPRLWKDRAPLETELLYPTWDSQPRVREHTGWELLEWSVCTIPMNGFCTMKDMQNAQKGILKAVEDGAILPENRIVIDILKKTNYAIPKIKINLLTNTRTKQMTPLTAEQITAVNEALKQPIIDATVALLTADTYNQTPEDATACAEHCVAAFADAMVDFHMEGMEDTGNPDAMKNFKSMFAKKLMETKAGASHSAAHKAEVAALNDSMQTTAKLAKALNAKVSAAKEEEGKSIDIKAELEIRALRAENELLKSKQPTPETLVTGMTEAELKAYLN